MNIIKRILQDKISERIEPNKAVLLFGARRVGKTVLIRELIKEFKGQSMLLNGEDYDTIALLTEYFQLQAFIRRDRFASY